MDPAREIYKGRGGGPVSVRNVLLCSGAGGVTLWGGDLGVVGSNGKMLEGVHLGFLQQVAVKTGRRKWYGTWGRVAAEIVLK